MSNDETENVRRAMLASGQPQRDLAALKSVGTLRNCRPHFMSPPFFDINFAGPEGVFPEDKVTKLVAMLSEVRQRATSVTFASHNA
jgi:hypothetical protein